MAGADETNEDRVRRYFDAMEHIHIFRLKDGLITDHWAARDDVGLLLQLGGIDPARS